MPVHGLGVVLSKVPCWRMAAVISQVSKETSVECDFFPKQLDMAGSEKKERVCPATFTFCCTLAFKKKNKIAMIAVFAFSHVNM